MNTNRPRFLYAFLIIPLLLGAKEGKRGCCGPKDAPDTAVVVDPPDVVKKLQIVSMDPSTGKPNDSFSAMVYGSSFVDGASLKLGDTPIIKAFFKDENTYQIVVPALPSGSYDLTLTNPDGTSATLRRALSIKNGLDECRSTTVNFDFDKADITTSSKSTLDGKMSCYQGAGAINVAGHADERGTTEYNLALGERRAETVKRYLTNGGVSSTKVKTVSYGEERPVSTGHDEGSWAQNRRAEINASE